MGAIRKKAAVAAATPAPVPVAAPVNMVEQSAAVWAAVDYLAGKAAASGRDDLPDGHNCKVRLRIVAQVDGGPVFEKIFDGALTVGHLSEVAPSTTPGGDALLCAIALGKLNAETRAAVLREVLADYGAGQIPAADAAILAQVKATQAEIRGMYRSERRGSVKYDGKPAQPALGVLGDF